LKEHDLRDLPLPYPSHFCNHILSVAVLNSFGDLDGLFQEIGRIIKPGGIFVFTVEEQKPGQEDRYAINRVEVSEKPKEEIAVMLFRHSTDYVTRLLEQNRFTLLKTLELVAFKYPAENKDVFFKAYVARRHPDAKSQENIE
jgi:SAM-dependent methyltransferase